MTTFNEFRSEVIEVLCALEGCSDDQAQVLATNSSDDIAYGYKYHLSPEIVAGAILGINHCGCVSQRPKG